MSAMHVFRMQGYDDDEGNNYYITIMNTKFVN